MSNLNAFTNKTNIIKYIGTLYLNYFELVTCKEEFRIKRATPS